MDRKELINGILKAEKEDDGINLLDLGPIPNFEDLKKEVEIITNTYNCSYVTNDKEKYGHFIKEGDIDFNDILDKIFQTTSRVNRGFEQIQGMLKGRKLFRKEPGWIDDCIDYIKYGDPNNPWKFWYGDEFPTINNIINGFKYPARVWISGLMPGTRFIPHREVISWNWNNQPVIVPRLHIPFLDDESSIFNVNGYNYNLKEGHLYFVNIGAYHYAANNSNTSRYHVLIDAILDEALLERLQNGTVPTPNEYVGKEEINPLHNKRSDIPAEDRIYEKMKILN